ncbi:TonB-dependent receptor [Bacteroides thetaiotaomicron]|nr:TonB-dependent receptor [Bacteroides thetaiotaomicron]
MNRLLWLLMMFSCFAATSFGQATTSSMSGRVEDEQNEPLPGTTVIAIHEPSGTRYGTVTNMQGTYHLEGMRTGGPYRVEFSYVGYRTAIFANITLKLAETYICDAKLKESAELDEVVVLGTASKFAGEKTGASTHITSKDISRFPNISRSLTAITKMSPYATRTGFGGRDQRMNNYTIDGANFNYSMGLDGAVLPGGGNPISIDALEEVQVSIAPFDVRQSNFVGGSVNAVTKSGTNQFRGSAYMYTKNEFLRGNDVDGYNLGEREEERRNVYGFTFGGPILKNKLFFFVNGEYENSPQPIHKWKLSTDGQEDVQSLVSRVTAEDMSRFSQDLKSMYGYDTGSWTNFAGCTDVYRAMARLDWNISDSHRLMLRYNYTGQEKDNTLVGAALNINGAPVSRYSMSFRNSTWKQLDNVSSLTAELNSRFNAKITNQLLASFTFNDGNKRECNGDFPTVDIMKLDETGTNRAFMNAGYEQHAWKNGIKERVWSITNNLSMHWGNHNLTLGASFESQNVSNCYMRYGAGYYRYNSYEDFVNKEAPVAFALCYSLTGEDEALASVHYDQFSLYAQDQYNVNERLKLLYGIRMDIPLYVNRRYENPSIASYEFNGMKLSTAYWPKATPLFSPRIGFNYDLSGDQSLKLRGGTGLFTGRFPLIFLSKMQEGSGMLKTTVSVLQNTKDPRDKELLAALAGGIRNPQQILSEIAPQFPDCFPMEPGAVNEIITIDRKFKTPQVWTSSLALDYRLPLPFRSDVTLEAMYIKDINAILQQNVNMIPLDDPKMTRLSGADDRYIYPGNKDNRINEEVTRTMLMTNTSKGYSYTLNTTLHTEPVRNLDLMASYTYTRSRTLSNNASNQIENAWQQEPSVQGANYLVMHNASYLDSPHRVIASASYTIEYAKNFATSISLFYTGQHNGSYTYLIDGDMNNDGFQYDLMYVPATRDELNFTDLKKADGSILFSASEQREAFWAFVEQDPYLRKRKGKYAETNGAFQPWYHRFDLRLVQDIKVKAGKTTNTLQLSMDIMNIGNLLNSSWGTAKAAVTNKPLQYKGVNEQNEPVYVMNVLTEDGTTLLPYRSFAPSRISTNCWQLQFGIRYIFN